MLTVGLVHYFQNSLVLPILTPQAAILDFLIPQIVTTISRKIKYLRYMFIDPEKNNSSLLTTSSQKSKVQKR